MKKGKRFFNTINEAGQTLMDFESKAISLEEQVYKFFKARKVANWCDAYKSIPGCHEISIKRSISNLTNAGKLIKTRDMVQGVYGKKVHLYKLKEEADQDVVVGSEHKTLSPMEELFKKFGHLLPNIESEYIDKELKFSKKINQ